VSCSIAIQPARELAIESLARHAGAQEKREKKTHTRGTQNPTVKFRENDDDEGKRNKKNRKKKHDKVLKK
jgi:hypothetical protein